MLKVPEILERSESENFASYESDILPPTLQPCLNIYSAL